MIWCRNYGVRTRLSAKSPTSVYRIRSHAGENERKFLEIRCWRVKNYSWEKSILLNDGGKVKKTNEQTNKQTELFNLSNKIIQTSRCRPPCIKRETLKMHDLLPLLIIFQAKFFFDLTSDFPFLPSFIRPDRNTGHRQNSFSILVCPSIQGWRDSPSWFKTFRMFYTT